MTGRSSLVFGEGKDATILKIYLHSRHSSYSVYYIHYSLLAQGNYF